MRRLQLDWGRIPWTLWVYAAVTLVSSTISLFVIDEPVLVLGILIVFTLTWTYFLFRGVRWLWMFTLGVSVLDMVLEVVAGPIHWRAFAVGAISLVVLSLPVTRRFFAPGSAAVTA